MSPYLNIQGTVLAGEAILRSGTDEQRERFLRPTLRGDVLWCQLFSEPDAGSDLAGLTTTAVADGDGYRVDGHKVWSSNAQVAEHAILLARTDPSRRGHRVGGHRVVGQGAATHRNDGNWGWSSCL